MAEITASLVKELREKTGAGMMDCKRALGEVQGDLEKAIDWLRTKGLSAAAKKARCGAIYFGSTAPSTRPRQRTPRTRRPGHNRPAVSASPHPPPRPQRSQRPGGQKSPPGRCHIAPKCNCVPVRRSCTLPPNALRCCTSPRR